MAATSVIVFGGALLAGCGAAIEPTPSPSPALAAPSSAVSIPPTGITLRNWGFTYGPLDAFSIPASAVVTDRVDQPNAVTVVMSAPSTAELTAYYRTALPAAGFTITADDAATDTLTFRGNGWTGVLTGTPDATAVSLRPA